MEGYIYIEDSKVVWNPEERPKLPPELSNHWANAIESRLFKEALKQWQSECIEVDNAKSTGPGMVVYKVTEGSMGEVLGIYNPGQKVTIEGKTITKLLWKK